MRAKKQLRVIIHGGAGRSESSTISNKDYRKALKDICTKTYDFLKQQNSAKEAAIFAIRLLEDNPLFNAGTGAKLQADGIVRLTAAIIDSKSGIFSGVMNVENVQHPIDIAELLSHEKHNLLAGTPAKDFAKSKNVADYNPIIPERLREYQEKFCGKSGTVGAVVLDARGVICAATSTGGIGGETPGRVSDSATVAGTYASAHGGVSCTGIGEQITRMAVAARLVTMMEEGKSLQEAAKQVIKNANANKFHFGFIALDRNGHWYAAKTRGVNTLYAAHDGVSVKTF